VRHCFILILLFVCTSVWGQEFVFEKIRTSEGLSQNDVNDIFQDKNGFLWIATNDGLNRYDGYNFKIFAHKPYSDEGISSNLVFCMTEDTDGNIWLGTSDEGVCKFDVTTERFYVYKNTDKNPNLIGANRITTILAAKDGSIWVGTGYGISILRFDGDSVVTETINRENTPGLKSDVVNTLCEDIYGRKWIGTKLGLYIYDDTGEINKLTTANEWGYVTDIHIADAEVYVAYTVGVSRLRFNWETLSDFQSEMVSDENPRSIILNDYGDLYVGTNYGLLVYERDPLHKSNFKKPVLYSEGWEDYNLTKNVITSLYKDKSGIIWIGTNGGGLNKYNPQHKKFRHFNKTREEGSLSYNKIRAIYEDRQKNIWIGTEGEGVNFLPFSENKNFASGFQYINVNQISGQNHAYSLVDMNSEGEVKMIVGSGYPSVINVIRCSGEKPQLIEKGILNEVLNSPFAMLKDRMGNIWFGTYGIKGLFKYTHDKNGESVKQYFSDGAENGLVSNTIRSLMQDSYGNIWIGTDKGLNLLTPEQQNSENPKFILFQKDSNNPNAISHNYILPIFQAADNTIWVGTMGGGLNKLIYHSNPDSIKFKGITVNDGLPNNVIKGILEDDYGFLWISSNKGLTRYDVTDNLFVNYDVSDGLQDNEFGELACCKLSDGEMLFGGVNGFNAFYPQQIVSDMSTPTLALTDFHILNQSVSAGQKVNGRVLLEKVVNHTDEVKLKYSENSFAIYFSSLHFSAPGKNTYKYMLEGFDNEWVRKDASDRIAKYTNLPWGKYTFKVMASNNDGIWSANTKTINITVTPPWYFTGVAWFIYVSIFLASLWFFQKYSVIHIKQKNELLMEHFEKEKIQELSQMKLRFFTNISHEFRTPLTLIIGPLEKLIRKGDYDKKTVQSFSIMHRNASILLRLINQLIDFRKFEQGKMKLRASNTNVVAFLNEVFLSFTELAENKSIIYTFASPRNNISLWFDEDKLERIMYNLLSNAFKFTSEGGKIDLELDEDDFHVIVKVKDNGVGIPEEMQTHIFERFYQTERIQNRKVGSTGIGLSFIKGLVEMHNGEINFESKENEGTTFTVSFQKGNAHLKDEQMREVSRDVQSSVKNFSFLEPVKIVDETIEEDGKKKPTILLVEDNFELRKFVQESLANNYKIVLADNGQEGLEKIFEYDPTVVVSDIMMPVMDGFEFCEKIKSDEAISHIPVVLLTAKSAAEHRIEGYNKGADGYIAKPFSMEVLEARIQNLIDSREKLRLKLRTTITVEPSEVTTTSMDERFLKRILRIIEENLTDPEFSVAQLANEYGMSQNVFHKKLKGVTGQTPKAFIRSIRLKRAAQLFTTAKYSVADVTYEVGFLDTKYFRNCFKEEFGLLPTEYIKEHKKD
jgi:signal transduction histidine kinase/ligand-binding sensor domain-containing protein/DNA-binding response OmpR family regulator